MLYLKRHAILTLVLPFLLCQWLASTAMANEVFLSTSLANSEATYVVQFDTTAGGGIRFFDIVFPDGVNGSTDLGRLEFDGSPVSGATIAVTPPTTVRVRRPNAATISADTKIRIEIFNLTNPLPGLYSLSVTAFLDNGLTAVGSTLTIPFETFVSGDITSVNPGTGLSGGGASGDVTLNVDTAQIQKRVVGICTPGSSIREIDATGNVVCEPDDNSGGTVTSVGTGAGLTGGPITTVGTISVANGGITSAMIADGTVGSADVNSTQVQLRVGGSCLAGNAIRVVNENGTVTCESTGIGGSGTANTIAKFTAPTTIGNSVISEVGGNVGIGTTSPGAKLHVSGAQGTSLLSLEGGGVNLFNAVVEPTAGNRVVRFNNGSGVGSGGFEFFGSDTLINKSLVMIQNNGNVGIGTTGPLSELHIQSTVPEIVLKDSDAGVDVKTARMYSSDGKFILDAPNDAYTAVPAANIIVGDLATGNVGIGTTSPAAKLAIFDGGDTNPNLYVVAAGNTPTRVRFERLGASAPDFIITGSFTSVGNVGIGTASPTSKLHVIGDITASGAKNFQIDHPSEPEKKLLIHSALEGPEAAVYYRGEAQLKDGEAEITLPSYFEALTRKEQRTVQLTPIKGWSPLFVADEIQEGRFSVKTANGGNPTQRFYWEVKAVRADVDPLVVERLKENVKLAENLKGVE